MESSTRVFISGLPPTFSSDALRGHFSNQFDVTDAHVIPHRRIGFVGFKSHNLAQNAVKYFHKTFIKMSKISVEIARPVDADPGTDLRSKYRKHLNSSKDVASLKRKRDTEEAKDDPKLQEYMAAMQPPSKSRTWADSGAGPSRNGLEVPKKSDQLDTRMEEAPLPKPSKVETKANIEPSPPKGSENSKALDSNDDTAAAHVPLTKPVDESDDKADESSEGQDGPKSDAEWLRSRTSRLLGLVDEDEQKDFQPWTPKPSVSEAVEEGPEVQMLDSNSTEPLDESKPDEPPPPDANLELIRNTGRLFIRNLPYNSAESELDEIFSAFGKLEELHVAFDTRHSTSKGFAYVQYMEPDSAIEAYKELDGTDFQGRLLHILPASAKKTYKLNDYEISKLPLKKQQLIKRKSEAASSSFSWNSLYMNTDAVMASVADRLGVPKSELLDPTSSGAAIKQAHAETHVIQETKAYFSANGVNLDSFKQRERGNTAILLKNFSFGVTAEELRSLCDPCGQITRFLMPPSGTIAIVEFSMPDEAQKAFKSLAYRKIGDSILFLEKAPKDLFEGGSVTPAAATHGQKVVSQGFSTSDTFKADEADEAEAPMESSTLFVRNLNFTTTDAVLTDLFKPLGGFMSAKVKTKPDPKKPGERLSMGFGFVEFKSRAQAQTALAAMNGYKLEQHELVIKPSHKGADAAEQQKREDTAKKISARRTKIIIKNLPFQTTKEDIRSLFSAYGQLRSLRVPKKFDRTARGFAFADFVSAREAENAMDALRNTHLLGRRLVLDFASEEAIDPEDEIQKIEKKMEGQVNRVKAQKLMGSGRKKFNVDAGLDAD